MKLWSTMKFHFQIFPFFDHRQIKTLEIKAGSHTHVCKITLKLLLFSPWQNGVDFLSIAIKLMTAFSLSAKAHYNFLPNKEGKKWKTRRMDGDHQDTIGPNNLLNIPAFYWKAFQTLKFYRLEVKQWCSAQYLDSGQRQNIVG